MINEEILINGYYMYKLKGNNLYLLYKEEVKMIINLNVIINGKKIVFNKSEKIDSNNYVFYNNDYDYIGNLKINKNKRLSYHIENLEDYVSSIIFFKKGYIDKIIFKSFSYDYNNDFWSGESVKIEISSSIIPQNQEVADVYRTWHMAPTQRVIAQKLSNIDKDNWFGYSVPGALPVGKTIFKNTHKTSPIEFHNYYSKNKENKSPSIFLFEGLELSDNILDEHYKLTSEICNFEDADYHKWWSYPVFCPGIDIMEEMEHEKNNKLILPMNENNIIEYVKFMEKKLGMNKFNILIDGLWFHKIGDYDKFHSKFKDAYTFRKMVDELHEMGHKVIIWLSHFAIDYDSYVRDSFSEYHIDYEVGKLVTFSSLFFDHSEPKIRNLFKKYIQFIFGSDENSLNIDGVKLDLGYLTPDITKHKPNDTTFGVGDELRVNVNKYLIDEIKKIKNDAYISDTALEPSVPMNVIRLNDDWTENCDAWIERASKAVKNKNKLIDTDGFHMFREKFKKYSLLSPVIGIPSFYSMTVFNGKEKITDMDYCRLRAGWNVYMNSVVDLNQEYKFDKSRGVYYRKYKEGRLKGFYSAITDNGNYLITYSSEKIMITSNIDSFIVLELPKDMEIKEVKYMNNNMIYELGEIVKQLNNNKVLIEIFDCTNRINFIEIVMG